MAASTILIVDDEQELREVVKLFLEIEGYTVLTASDAHEGLAILECNEVFLVLSDQSMPGMEGTEFLRQVERRYPNTMRMILSGNTDVDDIRDALQAGVLHGFLSKPVSSGELTKAIGRLFAKQRD